MAEQSGIALALAGGGPGGAVYEIGALRALDEAIDGLDPNGLGTYIGVSAGAFIAACLANSLTTAQMCRAIVKPEPGEHPFIPETFFQPASSELRRRLATVPRLVAKALADFLEQPRDASLLETLTKVSRALPVGVFANEPIRAYLESIYTIKGRSDDFRQLACNLFVVAAELESGRPVRFGEPGLDHVPISKAVQASTALPGLYPPVEIGGRHYVDGVLLKTLHASVALDAGARLVLCVNPIVPVDLVNGLGGSHGFLVSRGLPTVLSQTFRTLIHSRMRVGMAAYEDRYPDADIVLIEPRPQDSRMFFTNIFSFSSRRQVCAYAYHATRRDLRARYDQLAPKLERHGLHLNRAVLDDRKRDIWDLLADDRPARVDRDTTDRLASDLDRLERLLVERAEGESASEIEMAG